jgi:uncharacterized FlaG/YvyC family protein
MNIRGITNIFTPLTSKANRREETAGADRDREGSSGGDGGNEKRPKLTDQEVQDALKKVQSLPGFKDQSLSARVEDRNGIKTIWIEDSAGKVIRRIPESQFASILVSTPNKPGHILNTAA